MRASAFKYTILSVLAALVMVILALVPFHAFLTIWVSSWLDNYTLLRLWKEFLLAAAVIGVLYLLLADHKIRSHTLTRRLVWTILIYMAVSVVCGLLALWRDDVNYKALGYGLIVNLRFLVFFLVVWAIALRTERLRNRWQPIILYSALIVTVFGLLQIFALPNDFLKHFGYSVATIEPYETINNNENYVRVASTLRGANPLGAYLLIPISVLMVLLIQGKRNWRYMLFMVAALLVLAFTFSRSAWLGLIISGAVILALTIKTREARLRVATFVAAGLLTVAGVVAFGHESKRFDNLVFHTEDNSTSQHSSNAKRASALQEGFDDVVSEPLGNGVGTAGPASIHNDQPTRIAENYYLQIAQEAGIIGLALFLLINLGVGFLLFIRRQDPLALCLFATLIGISFINLLSHAWTDDTLAYIWWGLAGIAMVNTSIYAKTKSYEKTTAKPSKTKTG